MKESFLKSVYLNWFMCDKSLQSCLIICNPSMAPHSSTLAWKISWTEEPGRLQSMGSLRVGHDWATSLSLSLSCIGEGNGTPLQCSCLENPRDGGAWWAAVSGVAQSRTRLKRHSSSSSRTVVGQSSLCTGFSRQEYCSGLLCLPPRGLPSPELKPISSVAPALQANSLLLSYQGSIHKLIPMYVKWIARRIQQMLLWISLVTSLNCSVYQERPLNFTVKLKEKEGGLCHGQNTSQQKPQDLDNFIPSFRNKELPDKVSQT